MKFERKFERDRHRESHPSRGAWIEIALCVWGGGEQQVAPLTGCVD